MNQELKEQVYAMWQEKLSGSTIANKLGITRNSVMGLIYRIKKNGGQLRGREKKAKEDAKIKKVKKVMKAPKKEEPKIVKKEEPVIEVFNALSKHNVTLEGLKFRSCRFIVKDGFYDETLYCGRDIDRESYCEYHYKLCYYPAKRNLESIVGKL